MKYIWYLPKKVNILYVFFVLSRVFLPWPVSEIFARILFSRIGKLKIRDLGMIYIYQ